MKKKYEKHCLPEKDHDYFIVSRRFLKDYRMCRVCGDKEIFDYKANYCAQEYWAMNKDYYSNLEKAKLYDSNQKRDKALAFDNKALLEGFFDLNSYVESDGLVQHLLLNKDFENDLNDFLKSYVFLLKVKHERDYFKR